MVRQKMSSIWMPLSLAWKIDGHPSFFEASTSRGTFGKFAVLRDPFSAQPGRHRLGHKIVAQNNCFPRVCGKGSCFLANEDEIQHRRFNRCSIYLALASLNFSTSVSWLESPSPDLSGTPVSLPGTEDPDNVRPSGSFPDLWHRRNAGASCKSCG